MQTRLAHTHTHTHLVYEEYHEGFIIDGMFSLFASKIGAAEWKNQKRSPK